MSRKIILIIIIGLLFNMTNISFSIATPANEQMEFKDFINKIEDEVPKKLQEYGIPGAAIAIIHNGEVSWIEGFGVMDKGTNEAVTSKTVFQVASISKTVSAWGIMKLVDEGVINLDDPVEKYLTRWQLPTSEYSEEVTVRSLLSHTGGLSVGGYAGNKELKEILIEDSLHGNLGSRYQVNLLYEPGTKYQYSGGGYSVLQLLIEEVTGESFEEYMEKEVLLPLGMENSSFIWNSRIDNNLTNAYGVLGETLPNYLFVERAAAGLYTTVEDLATFLLASIEPSTQNLLPSNRIALMTEKTVLKNGTNISYGLGYSIGTLSNGVKKLGHDGNNRGWCASILGSPVDGSGIVILTNSYKGNHLINDLIADWEELLTGERPTYHINLVKQRNLIRGISIVFLLILSLYLLKISKQIQDGRRKFVTNSCFNRKRKVLKWLQIGVNTFLLIGVSVGLYAPIVSGGWTAAAFLPLGSGWLVITILLWSLTFTIAGLFPKTQSNHKISL
ncbi:serine hydrolase domain-containing protein [Alkaliphilus transvaalensis]|uniref:serine hydrolase domain-containing protein n=1 Tax=Alkaliphilus transvaalensis TaxID=114628 RepID=UPI0006846628|nr:serine hydrolase domain-containing protein [Alkaliphilus transvaalensis]